MSTDIGFNLYTRMSITIYLPKDIGIIIMQNIHPYDWIDIHLYYSSFHLFSYFFFQAAQSPFMKHYGHKGEGGGRLVILSWWRGKPCAELAD